MRLFKVTRVSPDIHIHMTIENREEEGELLLINHIKVFWSYLFRSIILVPHPDFQAVNMYNVKREKNQRNQRGKSSSMSSKLKPNKKVQKKPFNKKGSSNMGKAK